MSDLSSHHIGITVRDLDRAVAFYQDVFDLSVVAEFSVSGEAFATGVDVEAARARFAHLDAGSIRLELVEYEPAGDQSDSPQLNDQGAIHLGLETDDLDAFYADLPTDVETLSPPQTTDTGTRILFVRDPEGNLIEVLEL